MSPDKKHSTPPRRSSLRNAASRLTRAWMVSLKSRVKGMVDSLAHPSLLVVLPSVLRGPYVLLLSFLGSTGKQDDQVSPVFPEIDSQARPEINSILVDSAANALHIREVA